MPPHSPAVATPRQGVPGRVAPKHRDPASSQAAAPAPSRHGDWWNKVDSSLPAVAGNILRYWIALESFVRDDPAGKCWPGNHLLCARFGLGRPQAVQRVLQRLEDLGLIRREGRWVPGALVDGRYVKGHHERYIFLLHRTADPLTREQWDAMAERAALRAAAREEALADDVSDEEIGLGDVDTGGGGGRDDDDGDDEGDDRDDRDDARDAWLLAYRAKQAHREAVLESGPAAEVDEVWREHEAVGNHRAAATWLADDAGINAMNDPNFLELLRRDGPPIGYLALPAAWRPWYLGLMVGCGPGGCVWRADGTPVPDDEVDPRDYFELALRRPLLAKFIAAADRDYREGEEHPEARTAAVRLAYRHARKLLEEDSDLGLPHPETGWPADFHEELKAVPWTAVLLGALVAAGAATPTWAEVQARRLGLPLPLPTAPPA